MINENILADIPKNRTFSRVELYHMMIESMGKELNIGTFQWFIYNMEQKGKIFHIGYDCYSAVRPGTRAKYEPQYSNPAQKLMKQLSEKYPLIPFTVFESTLLNEFLNHQIAQNTVFLQVPREIGSFVFDSLKGNHNNPVLYRPGKTDFDRYWTAGCICILDLVSQYPQNKEKPHHISIEKMLVDIIADKAISMVYSTAEQKDIFYTAHSIYAIDDKRMLRYAGRRHSRERIDKLIGADK